MALTGFPITVVLVHLRHGGQRWAGTGWNCSIISYSSLFAITAKEGCPDRAGDLLVPYRTWSDAPFDAYPCRHLGHSWVVGWSDLSPLLPQRSQLQTRSLSGNLQGFLAEACLWGPVMAQATALAKHWIRAIIPIARLLVSLCPGGVISTPSVTSYYSL